MARFNMKLRIAPAFTANSFNIHESDGQRLEGHHRRGGSCPLTFPLSASADWTHHIAKRAFDSGSKSGGRKSRISARFVVGSDHRWRASSYPEAVIKFLEDSTRSGAVVPCRKLGVCMVDGNHNDLRYRWRKK